MPGTLRLTILHTNDIHGRVHQLSRIATLVRQVRQDVHAGGGYCLYLDAGDAEDTSLVESALTRGAVMNALLRAAGCDQAALGNAVPVRYGPQAVANLAKSFGKPLLCANMFTAEGNLVPGVTAFQIITFGALPVAIVGFTATMRDFYSNFFKFPTSEPDEIMPSLIARVRANGAKTIITLNHIGSNLDIALAEQVSGIDLIIGGHDHKRISPPIVVNNTLIAQAGMFGQDLGRLDLEIDSSTGRILSHSHTLIPITEDIAEDPVVLAAVSIENQAIDKMMCLKIGELLLPLSTYDDRESPAGNLQADAVKEHMQGAELSFMITGHWVNGLEAGEVTQGQLYSANRSAGNPALVHLTGAQIRQWLTAALDPQNAAKEIHPLRGKKVGLPGLSGMQVTADAADLNSMQVTINNEPLTEERVYRVATTDLEISEILGYLPIPDSEAQYEVPIVLPEIIEEYIKKHSPIQAVEMGRLILK
jgi:2',3'-cyclic-nucleotide 2'-phosphodiesterase (5'-nucleotidase family)